MTSFTAPVNDILFSLETIADANRIPDWDSDLASEIIAHFGAFAEGVIAPLNEIGHSQGCQLEGGRVRMPDGWAYLWSRAQFKCLANRPLSRRLRFGRGNFTISGGLAG